MSRIDRIQQIQSWRQPDHTLATPALVELAALAQQVSRIGMAQDKARQQP